MAEYTSATTNVQRHMRSIEAVQERSRATTPRPVRYAGGSTLAGSHTMNVDPWPEILVTVRSPPISRQKWRLIASPSPVPPYLST